MKKIIYLSYNTQGQVWWLNKEAYSLMGLHKVIPDKHKIVLSNGIIAEKKNDCIF